MLASASVGRFNEENGRHVVVVIVEGPLLGREGIAVRVVVVSDNVFVLHGHVVVISVVVDNVDHFPLGLHHQDGHGSVAVAVIARVRAGRIGRWAVMAQLLMMNAAAAARASRRRDGWSVPYLPDSCRP